MDELSEKRAHKEATLDMIDELGIKLYTLKQLLLKSLYDDEAVESDVSGLKTIRVRVRAALRLIKGTDGLISDLGFND